MGTALCHQNNISVCKSFHGGHSFNLCFQIALVAGEQDGEGSEGHSIRSIPVSPGKGLGVCDNKPGRLSQPGQSFGELGIPAGGGDGAGFKYVPDHLLLWQDQPALRCG